MKKTQITSQTYRLPLLNFSQSAIVALNPDPTEVIKHVLINKAIRRLLSIMSERGSPRTLYTAGFKLLVIAHAVSHSNHAAGRQFSIHESCTRQWRSHREHLQKSHGTSKQNVLGPLLSLTSRKKLQHG